MQVSVEKSSALERRLRIQVPGEQFQKKIDARLRELGKQVRIKGFRPGRVPFKVLQQRYGPSVRQEILAQEVQSSLAEAIQNQAIRPAAAPVLEGEPDFSAEGHLEYTATVAVLPDIEPIDIGGLEIERPEAEVLEEDVEDMLETLRDQRQTWSEVERPVTDGDQVTIEYTAETEQGRVPEQGHQRVAVIVGQSGFQELEQAVTGMEKGSEKETEMNFPEAYRDQSLAGHKAKVSLTVTEVQESDRPEVDESFIKSFGIESGSMDEMVGEIRKNLERELQQARASLLKVRLAECLLAGHESLELPEALVREEAANLQRQMANNMGVEAEGQNLEPFMDAAGKRVKSGLLLSEIARQNNIMVDGARVRTTIKSMADTYEQPQEVIRLYYNDERLLRSVENAVLEEQVVDWVMEKAKVTDVPMSFKDVINAASRGGQAA